MVERLTRVLLGWVNYFCLGYVAPAYPAIDAHATKWLCWKHQVHAGKA